jgi:hypothetical protein
VFADQFQRNGVTLGQAFLLFGMAIPVLSVEEGRCSFSGIFEIVTADKAAVVGWKRRPFFARNVDCRPRRPFATLAARPTPSPSLPAQGGEGKQGPMLNHRVGQLTTQR